QIGRFLKIASVCLCDDLTCGRLLPRGLRNRLQMRLPKIERLHHNSSRCIVILKGVKCMKQIRGKNERPRSPSFTDSLPQICRLLAKASMQIALSENVEYGKVPSERCFGAWRSAVI